MTSTSVQRWPHFAACQRVQRDLSETGCNDGRPLNALALHRAMYAGVAGTLHSQMTCSASRLTAGAYASAKRDRHSTQKPMAFRRARALFLVGTRGRDADFRQDGTLSIWTVAGRKCISYRVPEAFKSTLGAAKEIERVAVIERTGQLLGRVTLTLEGPEPQGIVPLGIDRNGTKALVAVNPDGATLCVGGRSVKVANQRSCTRRKRLQKTRAAHTAEHTDTRSVRRASKRLGRKRSNRTRTFAQTAAKRLAQWAAGNAVLVFEALTIPHPQRGLLGGPAPRRRLSQWQRGLIRRAVESTAREVGMVVAEVDPAHTSRHCRHCGLRGIRKRHSCTCPSCGYAQHADSNAAVTMRNRSTAFRSSGLPVSPPRSTDSSELRASPRL